MERVYEILWSALNALISSMIIAILFGIWNDHQGYNLTGTWNGEKLVKETSLSTHQNMTVGYYIFLAEFKQKIIMNAEKRYDVVDSNKSIYKAENRTQLACEGEKSFNFFSTNKIVFNCFEEGRKRDTITIFDLIVKSENELVGTFSSSAADEKGTVRFIKN